MKSLKGVPDSFYVTSDCVVFGFEGDELKVLLLKREKSPYKGKWALPGGFIRKNETADACAKRILKEKVGLNEIYMEQLFSFTALKRDPRDRVLSIGHFALINQKLYNAVAGRDAMEVRWFKLDEIAGLAFDHNAIIEMAVSRLRNKINYQPIGFELLNEKFTLSQLQRLYESILGYEIDKRNFRKKILLMGLLKRTKEKEKNVSHKAAFFYMFDAVAYQRLTKKGFHFEL